VAATLPCQKDAIIQFELLRQVPGRGPGPLGGARSEEEELGPAAVKPRSPGGKVLSTKIRYSGGTQLILALEGLSSPIVSLYRYHQKNRWDGCAPDLGPFTI